MYLLVRNCRGIPVLVDMGGNKDGSFGFNGERGARRASITKSRDFIC